MPVRLLRWKTASNAETVVRSPLAKYLARQRPSSPATWGPALADIYARDYAVLARFRVDNPSAVSESPFYHYYLAGIRGLGTWGAGWFVERYADILARFAEECGPGNIQILLEVIYKNYRIVDVRVVTKETQDYFDERYSDRFIEGELARHHE